MGKLWETQGTPEEGKDAMANAFEPGTCFTIKTAETANAVKALAFVFGTCEIYPAAQESPFGANIQIATFETVSFLRWGISPTDVVISLPRHLICTVRGGSVWYDEEGKFAELDPSCAIVFPPSAPLRLRWSGDAILVGVLLAEQDFRRQASVVFPSSPVLRLGGLRKLGLAAHPGRAFSELMDFLLADMENSQSWKTNRAVRLLFDRLIAYTLLRLLKDEGSGPQIASSKGVAPRHVKHAEDYIRSHLSEPLDNALLARVVEVSPRSLYRAFLHFRGVTPARYILELRLSAAHDMLVSGTDSHDIRDVAVRTGFRSYPAFWRSYVRKFGVPPSKARGPYRAAGV